MIERMSKVTVFSESSRKDELLLSLREFGAMHITNLVDKTDCVDELEKVNAKYNKILSIIAENVGKKKGKTPQKALSDSDFDSLVKALESAIEEKSTLESEIHDLSVERDRISGFGDFDVNQLETLEKEGFKIDFYTLSRKELSKLDQEEVPYIKVAYSGKMEAIALVNADLPEGVQATLFEKPTMSLAKIEARLLSDKERIKALDERFVSADSYTDAFKKRIESNDERIVFERVSSTVEDESSIIYISGYIPAEKNDAFKSYCKKNTLAYLVDSPSEEDAPPTLVKRKGFVRFIGPVFDMLNLIPGYNEPDISLWFEIFLTVFFAMIIGDAGYGVLFLIVAIILNIKNKKCSDVNSLLYIFSGSTIIWGALTGTWFGSEAILANVPFLQFFVIPAITNFPSVMGVDADFAQNMLMKFCFMLGTVHISLACLINVFRKIPKKDLSFVADIGWLIDTCLLYLLVLYLVIGESAPLGLIVTGVAVGFVLVSLFGAQEPGLPFGKGVKASLGGVFTNFLDTVSCFSNIMSYIRLFAVGMASLAIAQSFNDMAAPMLHSLALPAGILILVIGHVINIVMGLLSVVVHGVRLNVLEFSNQLGMEWSGYKYDPFRSKNQDRVNNAV